ncbi:hypothetical protein [Methylorubrum aminovorans]
MTTSTYYEAPAADEATTLVHRLEATSQGLHGDDQAWLAGIFLEDAKLYGGNVRRRDQARSPSETDALGLWHRDFVLPLL